MDSWAMDQYKTNLTFLKRKKKTHQERKIYKRKLKNKTSRSRNTPAPLKIDTTWEKGGVFPPFGCHTITRYQYRGVSISGKEKIERLLIKSILF
jgi:hypothetical protein